MRTAKWFLRELERRERAWEQERAQLIETICRLAGQPTEPTPMDEWREERAREREEDDDDLVDPDQLPDDEVV